MTDETPSPLAQPAQLSTVYPRPPTASAASVREEPAHVDAVPPAEASRRPSLIAIVILALIMLVGGIALWRQGSAASDQVTQIAGRLDAMDVRIAKLESRPPPPDLRPLEQHVAGLEARQPPDLRPLEQRLTTLEQKPPPESRLDTAGQQQIAALAGRVDGIGARQDQLGTRQQADVAKLNDALGAMDQKIAAAVAAGGVVAARADKAGNDVAVLTRNETRIARLQAAAVALADGRPLGDIPGAPPALSQFATKPPPTEAGLRLSFAAAAQATQDAGQPPKEETPFFTRMWNRAQSGLVVRQGDRVIVGDVVTGVLEHARHQLDAGDLGGAVSALDGLAGPAAAAMAPWRAQAQSLLDARAALLTVAHGLMRRVITFLIVCALLVAFAWWLAALPGTVGATVGDLVISVPTAWAIVGGIVLFALLYLLVRLVVMIVRLPSRTRRIGSARARTQGDQAVTRTLLALAGGDGAGAMKAAGRSRALLGDTPQTLLLAAYAGRQAGQVDEADKAFTLLAGRKDAAFLGLRGLLQGAVARGDWDAARALSQRAEEVNPDAPWLRSERARLALQKGDWKEALSLSGADDPLAAIGTAASDAATDTGEARRLAKEAWVADPGFTPAALAYVRRLREAGREKRAQEVLRTSWAKAPNPALAEAALAGSSDPTVRAWRVGALASAAPNHVESYLLRAQAEMEKGDLPRARREAEAAQAIGMDQRRVWRLLAAIAEREGNADAATTAMRRAADAEPDPQWRCANCGTIHDEWRPKCDACGAVGQIGWGQSGMTIPAPRLLAQGDALLP